MSQRVVDSPEAWRSGQAEVEGLDCRWVELCVEARPAGAPGRPGWALWGNPSIRPRHEAILEAAGPERGMTAEELEARRRHLEALGSAE